MSSAIKPVLSNIICSLKERSGCIVIKGLCIMILTGTRKSMDCNNLKFRLGAVGPEMKTSFAMRKGIPLPKGFRLNMYSACLDTHRLEELDLQNAVIPVYQKGKETFEGKLAYTVFEAGRTTYRNSRILSCEGKSVYLRQAMKNGVWLTVREPNFYDTPEAVKLVKTAMKSARSGKYSDSILMYEKECSRYEESASVLYERLIDLGYDNVYYVINRDNPRIPEIDEKYRKHFLYKDSPEHLACFFGSHKYIGTETRDHLVQLRIANRDVMKKVNDSNIIYVFLQHGPTYMVSLDADMRLPFRRRNMKMQRIVVSSELEARHFVELGGYLEEEMYVTGMAKFDRNTRNDNADRIIIMPTWRRWDLNQAEKDFKATGYYKLMKTMFDAVSDELKDKVDILPHPLMRSVMLKEDTELSKYIPEETSYDEILKNCDLLVTDYSSISYDAFYRGSNIVFFWKDLEECMKHYGGNAHLMIDEGSAFGDVCMDVNELQQAIKANYGTPQKDEYIRKYERIIRFHDGKNCDRIVEMLKKDGILKQ